MFFLPFVDCTCGNIIPECDMPFTKEGLRPIPFASALRYYDELETYYHNNKVICKNLFISIKCRPESEISKSVNPRTYISNVLKHLSTNKS